MASPPTTIVPLPVVIAKHCIFLAAERFTAEVVINPCVASAVIGEVPRPVAREVSVAIYREVVARTKLLRVSGAINLNVPCAVRREVSLAINRCVVACANLGVPHPISRDISITIDSNIMSRAKLLVPRHVSLPKSLIPREISLANSVHPGVLTDRRV
jgi:hypothetical protein